MKNKIFFALILVSVSLFAHDVKKSAPRKVFVDITPVHFNNLEKQSGQIDNLEETFSLNQDFDSIKGFEALSKAQQEEFVSRYKNEKTTDKKDK